MLTDSDTSFRFQFVELDLKNPQILYCVNFYAN